MKLADKLKCPHLSNYDYHSGYQQALIDAQPLVDAAVLIEHNLAVERGQKRDIALVRLGRLREYATHKIHCDTEAYGGETFEGMTVHCTCGFKEVVSRLPDVLWAAEGYIEHSVLVDVVRLSGAKLEIFREDKPILPSGEQVKVIVVG